jgi:hypothetical protein
VDILPHCSDPSLSCCQVAEHVRRAAEELTAAADELPVCDCAVLDEEHMARVVHDLGKAERAVINVHSGLRLLEQKHEGGPVGLATLEVRHTPTCACSLHIVGACPPSQQPFLLSSICLQTQPLEGLPAPGQPRILEQVAG